MALICVSSKDDNFIPQKEYKLDNGYLYTEFDISINTREYTSEQEAVEDLSAKGYTFKIDVPTMGYGQGAEKSIFGSSPFDTGGIFGDLSSFMNGISPEPSVDSKKAEAERMKNDILSDILKGI